MRPSCLAWGRPSSSPRAGRGIPSSPGGFPCRRWSSSAASPIRSISGIGRSSSSSRCPSISPPSRTRPRQATRGRGHADHRHPLLEICRDALPQRTLAAFAPAPVRHGRRRRCGAGRNRSRLRAAAGPAEPLLARRSGDLAQWRTNKKGPQLFPLRRLLPRPRGQGRVSDQQGLPADGPVAPELPPDRRQLCRPSLVWPVADLRQDQCHAGDGRRLHAAAGAEVHPDLQRA